MRKALHLTDSDSVAPETPRDAQDVAYVANQILGFDPTLKQVVGQLHKHTIILPVAAMANLADAQVLKVAVPFPFILNSVAYRVGDKAVTTAAKASTATAQVNGVSVTGGVVALTSANCTPSGAAVAGTAITAGNTGTADQTVGVVMSATTAFAEGNGWFEFNVTRKTA